MFVVVAVAVVVVLVLLLVLLLLLLVLVLVLLLLLLLLLLLPPIYLSVYLSIYLSICKLENEAILRDFLNCWTWQHQKRRSSARRPQFLNLTTSKTQQFYETSSFSKLTTSKTKHFCEIPSKMESWVQLTASYQCVLRFFHPTCLKYCTCYEKVMPGHKKCCTCHAKSSQQTWRSDAPKCNPSQEISARTA